MLSTEFETRLFTLHNLDKSKWLELENSSEDSYRVHQSYEWAQAKHDIEQERVLFLTFSSESKMVCGMQLTERANLLGQSLVSYGGPICLQNYHELVRLPLANVIKDLRKHYSMVYLQTCPGRTWSLDEYDLHRLLPYSETSIIDLTRPVDDLWKSLSKEARWSVNKAKKCNLRIEVENDWESWQKSLAIQNIHSSEKNYRSFKLSFLRRLFEVLRVSGKVALFGCYSDGTMIATLMLAMSPKQAVYYRGASLPMFREKQPGSLLLWEAVNWAKRNGLREFDMGGLPPENSALRSIRNFKQSWGGRKMTMEEYLENTFYRTSYKFIKEHKAFTKVFKFFSRGLPDSIRYPLN
jgi:lipid II:glycine glycyltransferase (peptidoglycan interpeptide bridge formation enzyme)